jgi:zinc protease
MKLKLFMKKMILFCVLAILLHASFGQPKKISGPSSIPAFVTSVEGVKEYSLANGLQVLLVPDPAQTNVIVNIVYHVV